MLKCMRSAHWYVEFRYKGSVMLVLVRCWANMSDVDQPSARRPLSQCTEAMLVSFELLALG